jgi:hypothetical protein
VTWQSAQRARRGVTVTVSAPDASDGAGPAAAERAQHTPDTAGRAGRPPAGFPRPLRAATPPSRHGSPITPASITYHDRTSTVAISCCRTPTLTACRHNVDDQVSGRHTTGVLRPLRPLDVGRVLLRRSDDADESPRGATGVGIVGDVDTRGQRHPEWGSTPQKPSSILTRRSLEHRQGVAEPGEDPFGKGPAGFVRRCPGGGMSSAGRCIPLAARWRRCRAVVFRGAPVVEYAFGRCGSR